MRKNLIFKTLNILIVVAFVTAILLAATYLYYHNESFKALFGPSKAAVLGPAEAARSLAATSERAGLLALYIFAGISALQLVTIYVGTMVLRSIRKSSDTAKVKLEKLENADIFMDLPLYVGFFGTVASFMVMTFSPTSSQIIAYSSTLIGIIFGMCMRLVLLYPFRSKLLTEVAAMNGDSAGKK